MSIINQTVDLQHDGAKRVDRLQVMINDDELAALDNWRFGARMPSRSAAVRELIRRGLAAEGYFQQAGQDASASYGILDGNKEGA